MPSLPTLAGERLNGTGEPSRRWCDTLSLTFTILGDKYVFFIIVVPFFIVCLFYSLVYRLSRLYRLFESVDQDNYLLHQNLLTIHDVETLARLADALATEVVNRIVNCQL